MPAAAAQLDKWESDPGRFAAQLQTLSPEATNQPVADGWTPRQIAAHLLDAELVFSVRLRTAIAEPGKAIQPFDQDAWSDNLPYAALSTVTVLAALIALRSANIRLLREIPDSAWDQTVEHPQAGSQTLTRIVQVFCNHIDEHLADLEKANGRA